MTTPTRGRKVAPRGRFVVLEGLDGAGTTTQARLLGEALRVSGRRVHVTAEPSGGPAGALARQVLASRVTGADGDGFDPAALALLFAADRLDHVATEIAPKLAAGIDVVSDRFTLSSLAYQGLTTGDLDWVEQVNARAARPDVTVFLRVRAAVALSPFSSSSVSFTSRRNSRMALPTPRPIPAKRVAPKRNTTMARMMRSSTGPMLRKIRNGILSPILPFPLYTPFKQPRGNRSEARRQLINVC